MHADQADKRWVALLPLQIHKIMAGLLDQAQLAGHPQALHMVENMAHYFCSRCVRLWVVGGQGCLVAVRDMQGLYLALVLGPPLPGAW